MMHWLKSNEHSTGKSFIMGLVSLIGMWAGLTLHVALQCFHLQ